MDGGSGLAVEHGADQPFLQEGHQGAASGADAGYGGSPFDVLPMMDEPLKDIFGAAPFGDGNRHAQPRARSINLGMLGAQLRGAVSIQDRRSGLTKHRNCFVGSEAAVWLQSWLRQAGYPDSERDAVTFGNQLMDTGLFEHVT
eukprot:COSAG02_NODE_27792_length_602_cov_1.226640_1_plen_142_part_10